MNRYCLTLLLLLATGLILPARAVEVICNDSVANKSLSQQQLRRIFTMRTTTWPDGSPIVVYVLSSKHPTHQAFSKQVLKLFPYQLDRLWHKLSFSGMGKTPVQVNSIEAMQQAVANTQGAIGYMEVYRKQAHISLIQIRK